MSKLRNIALVMLAMAITVSCFKKTDSVVIGIGGPFTGAYAAFGEQFKNGAYLAVEDINAAGGINGKKIELVEGDDACDPKQAVSVANKFVDQDKAIAVAGHFCSSSSIPASDVYATAGVLTMTPASTNPTYTERGLATVFRMCGRDDQQGSVAGEYIVNKFGAKKVVILHDKDTYGQGLADSTKKTINDLGVTEVLYEGITRGDKDYNALVTKIKSLNADLIYFGGLHTEAGLLIRQLFDQGVKIPFVSGDGIVSTDLVLVAGGNEYLENVYFTFGPDPLKIDAGKSVVAALQAKDQKAEGYTLYAYATIQTLAKALEQSDLDPVKAADYLHNNSVDTVLGPKQWDSKGDLTEADYVMYKFNNSGTYAELE